MSSFKLKEKPQSFYTNIIESVASLVEVISEMFVSPMLHAVD